LVCPSRSSNLPRSPSLLSSNPLTLTRNNPRESTGPRAPWPRFSPLSLVTEASQGRETLPPFQRVTPIPSQGQTAALPSCWGPSEGLGLHPPELRGRLGDRGSGLRSCAHAPVSSHGPPDPQGAPLERPLSLPQPMSWGVPGGRQRISSTLPPGLTAGAPLGLHCHGGPFQSPVRGLSRSAAARHSAGTDRAAAGGADAGSCLTSSGAQMTSAGVAPALPLVGAFLPMPLLQRPLLRILPLHIPPRLGPVGGGRGRAAVSPEWEAVLQRCASVRKWLVLVESPSKARLIQKYLNPTIAHSNGAKRGT